MTFDYQFITFTLGILGIIFTVYNYFKNPQIKSEQNDLLIDQKILGLSEAIANLRDNHVHTIENMMSKHISDQSINERNTATQLTRLQTILEERLPRIK